MFMSEWRREGEEMDSHLANVVTFIVIVAIVMVVGIVELFRNWER